MPPRPLAIAVRPWERQPPGGPGSAGESAGEYALFCDYLMGRRPRRIEGAARGFAVGQIHDAAYQWQWVIRADAYDSYLDLKRLEITEETYLERARRQAKLARKKQLVGEKGLDAALAEYARNAPDLPLDIVRPGVAGALVDQGVRLERDVLDSLPTVAPSSGDLSRLTDDEAALLARLIEKMHAPL